MILDPKYAEEFVRDWIAYGDRGRRFIRDAHRDAVALVRDLFWDRRRHGRVPHWCDLGDAVRAARILGRAVRELDIS